MWIYQRLKFFGWILLGLVVVFLLIVPAAFSFLVPLTGYSRTLFRWMQPIEFVQKVLVHVLTMAWMFFLGGCLASFLNVVAWRVPRGKSILGSSHCPTCGNRLAFRDNMPFVGWLRNSGLCRHCDASISVRYLIAEIVLGSIFLILGSVVFLSGAANWPIEKVLQPAGFEHLLFSLNWDVIKVLAWHLTLVCFLFTFALIEFDGLRIPKSIAIVGLSIVCVVAAVAPDVWLVLWRQPIFLWQANELSRLDQILNPALGAGVGFAVGWVNQWATSSSLGHRSAQVVGVILVGAFLGWQAVLAVGAINLFVWLCRYLLLRRLARERLVTPAGCLLLATVVHLLLWSSFYS
jgi:leader peptidase (prepilin peptidase)/N-methyltransferase